MRAEELLSFCDVLKRNRSAQILFEDVLKSEEHDAIILTTSAL
jgi:hypothetical protein